MKRIYLSGPMTGLPGLNFPAFHREAWRLRALGFEVVNPAEINPDAALSWQECMRADIRALCDCDTIALLPGYEKSRGACLELTIAMSLGMDVRHLGPEPVAEGGIYAIVGPKGRRYIGQAKSFSRRWMEHRSALRHGRHHCASLQRAWAKYGAAAFSFERMFVVPAGDERDNVEQQWLDILGRAGLYNSALYVRTPGLGRKHTPECRARMSASRAGSLNHNFGKKASEETKRLLSEAAHKRHAEGRGGCAGMPKTDAHRRNLSESLKGKLVGAKNPVACPVVCLDTGERFETYAAAAAWVRATGKPKADLSSIRKAARGISKSAYGFKWSALDKSAGAHVELNLAHRLGMEIVLAAELVEAREVAHG